MSYSKRRGFSLVELLVVIGIMSVLMALLLPAVQRVRQSAQQTQCLNNLKQMGLGLRSYEVVQKNLPPAYLFIGGVAPSQTLTVSPGGSKLLDSNYWMLLYYGIPYTGIDTAPGWGWAAYLLPHIDQQNAARQIDFKESLALPKYNTLRTTPIAIYQCPSDHEAGVYLVYNEANSPLVDAYTSSYAAVYGSSGQPGEQPDTGNGVFYRNSNTRLADIRDGLSQTLAIGERAAMFVKTPWLGAVTRGGVRTTPGAPVLVAGVEEAPTQVMARAGPLPLLDRYSTPYDFFSPHVNCVNFLFCDGSARRLSSGLSKATLGALATRDGGEVVNSDF